MQANKGIFEGSAGHFFRHNRFALESEWPGRPYPDENLLALKEFKISALRGKAGLVETLVIGIDGHYFKTHSGHGLAPGQVAWWNDPDFWAHWRKLLQYIRRLGFVGSQLSFNVEWLAYVLKEETWCQDVLVFLEHGLLQPRSVVPLE